jgi:hypothetical protein
MSCLKYMIGATVVLGVVLFAQAGPTSLWDIDDARAAVKLEILVNKSGEPTEIEFHIDPATVPAAVQAAMDKLHPGGPYTAAERERNDGVLYFELSREVGGFEVEAMFTPEGKLHSEEISVAADKVAPAVRAAVAKALPQGTVTAWEEIRNADRALIEYHVKVDNAGKHWKVMLSTSGAITGSVLEIPAEIEVPTPLP